MTKRKRSERDSVLSDSGDEDVHQFHLRKKLIPSFLAGITSPTSQYITRFQETKQELAIKLYEYYNRTVFDNKLPGSMAITWSKRLTSTAGQCLNREEGAQRYSRIELADKVCDAAYRVRDIMAHEMCHAACWLIDGVRTAGHGPLWQAHARRVTQVHPELPEVTMAHDYEINYPFTYQCRPCKKTVGRFREIPAYKAKCRSCGRRLGIVTTG